MTKNTKRNDFYAGAMVVDLAKSVGVVMKTRPGEPPEDGEMIEMTLSSRHRIRNSSPGGLRPSTLPLGHGGSSQYWLSHVDGEETFVSFKPPQTGTEPRTLAWKAAVLTTTLGPPPCWCCNLELQYHVLTYQIYNPKVLYNQSIVAHPGITSMLWKCHKLSMRYNILALAGEGCIHVVPFFQGMQPSLY